jgi:hypothetical protein
LTDPVPATPDVGAAVHALKPQLTRMSVVALALMTVIGVATVVSVVYLLNLIDDGGDRFKFGMITVIIGGLLMAFAYRHMRRKQEALVMPVVAQAVGMTYSKDAKFFLNGLPDRLLPRAAVRKAEDYVHGKLGNHTIQMAEVEIATGGKNSRTLFKGVVAQFRNSIQMPGFFLAPHAQTKPGMIFKAWIPTDGLYHLRDVVGASGVTYGVWTSWTDMQEPPALKAVVDILTSLESRLATPMTLFTATSNGEEMHVALSHDRNLFSVGGLFQDDARLFSDVFGATRDLAVPLDLVKELVAAEVAATEKVKEG